MDPDYAKHLKRFNALLTTNGVIGLTYFAQNKHVTELREFAKAADKTAHIPFSFDMTKMIREYFVLNNFDFFMQDEELIQFLGGVLFDKERQGSPKTPDHLPAAMQWTAFTQEAAEEAIGRAGMRIAAWVPSCFAKPFDEINNYSVRKFKSLGTTHKFFIENYMTQFRYTVYVTRDGPQEQVEKEGVKGVEQPSHWLGHRPVLTPLLFDSPRVSDIMVVDRLGKPTYISTVFNSILTCGGECITTLSLPHRLSRRLIQLYHRKGQAGL